jgi:hypothetical protein
MTKRRAMGTPAAPKGQTQAYRDSSSARDINALDRLISGAHRGLRTGCQVDCTRDTKAGLGTCDQSSGALEHECRTAGSAGAIQTFAGAWWAGDV